MKIVKLVSAVLEFCDREDRRPRRSATRLLRKRGSAGRTASSPTRLHGSRLDFGCPQHDQGVQGERVIIRGGAFLSRTNAPVLADSTSARARPFQQ